MTVYFAQGSESELVKIGFSRRTWSRMSEISSAGSDKLRLLRVCPGGRVAERWVHRYFAGARCHGEWFQFTPEMMTIQIPEEFQVDSDADTKIVPARYDINVEKRIQESIKDIYAHLRGADKIVASDANVLSRTARNWLSEANMPSAAALIHMLAANAAFRTSIYSLVKDLREHREIGSRGAIE